MRDVEGIDLQQVTEPGPILPSFNISEKDLPEVAGFEVGETYNLEVKVKMTNLREVDDLSPREASFEIVGVEVLDKGVWEKDKDQFKKMRVTAKSA